jgi:hypothetical protein
MATHPFCWVRTQYGGPPGSVEAEVSSVESKGNLVVCKTRSLKGRASTTICIGFGLEGQGFRLAPPSK